MSSPVDKFSPIQFYETLYDEKELAESSPLDQKTKGIAKDLLLNPPCKTAIELPWHEVIQDKWPSFLKEQIKQLSLNSLTDHIKERRKEIVNLRENYRAKQEVAESSLIEAEKYQSFRGFSEMREEVRTLMSHGKLECKEGGKSGVYILYDMTGEPQYVIKPPGEEFLGLDNPKQNASPYADNEVGRPKAGVPLYHSAENSELAYLFAKHLGVEWVTPKTDVMILESQIFSDITDGVGRDEEFIKAVGPAIREKLCIVQKFAPGFRELGDIVLSNSGLKQEQYCELDDDKKTEVLANAIPPDLDPEMFEDCCLLTWLIGEKDGNAGNFLISNDLSMNYTKSILKIDNAASCAEDNLELKSGISWFYAKYGENLISERMVKLIEKVDFDTLAELMRIRGKSEKAVLALKQRVDYLKSYIPLAQISDWNIMDLDYHLLEFFDKS